MMQKYCHNLSVPETSRWNQKAQFPWMVHLILEDAEQKGFTHVVSWTPNNQAFCVHDSDLFVQEILPLYFRQTQYKSFQRQLNLWGFEHVAKGAAYRTYAHKFFVRGQADLCKHMKRLKIKRNNEKMSCTAASQSPTVKGVTAQTQRIVSPESPCQIAAGLGDDGKIPLPSLSSTQQNSAREIPRPSGVDLIDDAALAATLQSLLHRSSKSTNNNASADARSDECCPSTSISGDILPHLVTSQPTVVNMGEVFGGKTIIAIDEANDGCEDTWDEAQPIFVNSQHFNPPPSIPIVENEFTTEYSFDFSPKCDEKRRFCSYGSPLDDLVTMMLTPSAKPHSSEPSFSQWNNCHRQ